jgi:hypothetical protein
MWYKNLGKQAQIRLIIAEVAQYWGEPMTFVTFSYAICHCHPDPNSDKIAN